MIESSCAMHSPLINNKNGSVHSINSNKRQYLNMDQMTVDLPPKILSTNANTHNNVVNGGMVCGQHTFQREPPLKRLRVSTLPVLHTSQSLVIDEYLNITCMCFYVCLQITCI